MAVIDFPSSPTMGQEYAFGDFIYVWDGVKWTTKVIVGNVPGGGGSTTYVSETAPVGADPGSTWFCTANGLTYILYADVDSIQWVEANPNYPQVDMGTGSSGGSQTYVGENAPVGAPEGSTWYCTGNGITYLLLNDGDSSQWVESNPNMSGGAGFVKKAGDTMSGNLTVQSASPVFSLDDTDGTNFWIQSNNGTLTIMDPNSEATGFSYSPDNNLTRVPWVATTHSQLDSPDALTRKDYVDGNFVNKTGDTMTGALRITNPAEDLCKIDVSTYAATPRVDFYDATGAYAGRFAYEDDVLILFNPKTSGKLSITPKGVESNVAFHSELNHSRGYMSIHPFGESYDGGGQAWIYYKDHDSGTPGVGMRGLVIETSDGATGTGGMMDITLNSSLVFHQNRPPTALEVGAVSREEFDTVVAELRAEIALLKGGV